MLTLKLAPRAAAKSASTIDEGETRPANSRINESRIPLLLASFVKILKTAGATFGVTTKLMAAAKPCSTTPKPGTTPEPVLGSGEKFPCISRISCTPAIIVSPAAKAAVASAFAVAVTVLPETDTETLFGISAAVTPAQPKSAGPFKNASFAYKGRNEGGSTSSEKVMTNVSPVFQMSSAVVS